MSGSKKNHDIDKNMHIGSNFTFFKKRHYVLFHKLNNRDKLIQQN
jgi:hypothetical protein